jgi:GT2 family glycosyltransferase
VRASPDTASARATIVAVPRERFSKAQEALESLLENTDSPFELVYVDGGSPHGLRRWLERRAQEREFRLLHVDRYLTPNEARNIGLREVSTEYVVFIDNDVLVRPGWLTKLVECADDTGAAVVSPLTCEYDFDTVHFAGGKVEIEEEREDAAIVRHVREQMYFPQRKLDSVRRELRRQQVELCEFHCVLARASVVRQIGGLDEELLSTREHLDFCLEVARAGGSVWFEPDSVVAYVPPPPLRISDLHFYMLRWSDDWERRSLKHFREKWDLADDEFFRARLGRLGWRRQSTTVNALVQRLTLGHGARPLRVVQRLERPMNDFLTRRHARGRERAAAGGPA